MFISMHLLGTSALSSRKSIIFVVAAPQNSYLFFCESYFHLIFLSWLGPERSDVDSLYEGRDMKFYFHI